MAKGVSPSGNLEKSKGRHLQLTGLETEVKERRSTEAFRSRQVAINLPKESSEPRSNLVIFSASLTKNPQSGRIA